MKPVNDLNEWPREGVEGIYMYVARPLLPPLVGLVMINAECPNVFGGGGVGGGLGANRHPLNFTVVI